MTQSKDTYGETLFRDWLKRKLVGHTQKKLAGMVGISTPYFNDLLQGRRQLSVATALLFERAFNDFSADAALHAELIAELRQARGKRKMSYGKLLSEVVGRLGRMLPGKEPIRATSVREWMRSRKQRQNMPDPTVVSEDRPVCGVCDKPLRGGETNVCDGCAHDWEDTVQAFSQGDDKR